MSVKTIAPKDLYRHMKLGHSVVLIDVRTPSEFEVAHINGAKLYPLETFNPEAVIHKINVPFPDPATIYVTCASGSRSTDACQRLENAGYEYITLLDGGIRAWRNAGLPIKSVKKGTHHHHTFHLLQQVEIAVGSIVILGTLLGTFVNMAFLTFSLLAGIALTYDGVFGTDYLKQAIARLTWNKNKSI